MKMKEGLGASVRFRLLMVYTMGHKANNTLIIFKTNLPSLTSAPLLPSFSRFFHPFFLKSF
jgi:hypothetical protein